MSTLHHIADRFFKDKQGKWVIGQFPNGLLIAWLVIMLVTMLLPKTPFSHSLNLLGSAVLFTWAYLELTDGASYFRRTLGTVVLLATIIGFFHLP